MNAASPYAAALAAACVALAWLMADQGMARCKALRDVAGSPRRLARLLIGALLPGALAGAAFLLLTTARFHGIAALIGFCVAALACAASLHRHHRNGWRAMAPWLAAMLAPLFVALAGIGQDAESWLLGGLTLAFALGLGIPAFSTLARHLDDADVPAFMRPLPARALTAAILALAMAGSVSW